MMTNMPRYECASGVTQFEFLQFSKKRLKKSEHRFFWCALDRVNFLIRFYPRFPHFVVVHRFARPTRDSLPIEPNIEHNTSFPAHSGFRWCVDLLVYFVPFVRDANNRFCSNSIICSFAFSSSSHSMYYGIVFAVRSHRIFLFNLITNGNVSCATAASLIICKFRFFLLQSNLYTNICLSYVNMTFNWSIAPDGCWMLAYMVWVPNGS